MRQNEVIIGRGYILNPGSTTWTKTQILQGRTMGRVVVPLAYGRYTEYSPGCTFTYVKELETGQRAFLCALEVNDGYWTPIARQAKDFLMSVEEWTLKNESYTSTMLEYNAKKAKYDEEVKAVEKDIDQFYSGPLSQSARVWTKSESGGSEVLDAVAIPYSHLNLLGELTKKDMQKFISLLIKRSEMSPPVCNV